jgi:hypothetical protein
VLNCSFFVDQEPKSFLEMNKLHLQKYVSANGNKYCYIDFQHENKKMDRVIFELFYLECPKTCENFLQLCKGLLMNSNKEKLTYENTKINRVVKNGYIQGGHMNNLSKFLKNNKI